MYLDDCFYLGYTTKTVNKEGEINVKLDVDLPHRYYNLESMFIQLSPADKQLVPFFIERITPQQKHFIRVKLEGIDTIEKAMEIVGKSVYLPLKLLPELKGNKFYFHEVIGFEVIDEHYGRVGAINRIIEYPAQAVFEIIVGIREVLIPITDEIIKQVNRQKKEIYIVAPEGLIELYLDA